MRVVLLAAVAVLIAVSSASAQQCHRCDDCEGGHENVVTYFSVMGNHDNAHPCYPYSCETMFFSGQHQPDQECSGGMAYVEASLEADLTREEAAALVDRYPQRILVQNDVLHVLDCAGTSVIAGFDLRTERPAKSEAEPLEWD